MPDARRERLERARVLEDRLVDLFTGVRDRLERDVVAPDLGARALVELDRVEDFFERDRWLFVSPFSRRTLFTVLAATSSARPP